MESTNGPRAINWYPGHMARAKRLLQEQLSRVDVVVEVCDARLPRASRNPDLDKLTGAKRRVLLLNKADLADPRKTEQWLAYFRQAGLACAAINAGANANAARALIARQVEDLVERAKAKGVSKTVRAMVVGVPNVGKSTIINRLHGGAITKVGDKPGVTRANQWVRVTPYLELLDTPGLLWPRLDDRAAARRLAYIAAIRDEVVEQEALCASLLDELMTLCAPAVVARYKIKNADARGQALLEEACRGRGFLLKGGLPDITRACAVVMDEFRAGLLGRITLEECARRDQAPRTPDPTDAD